MIETPICKRCDNGAMHWLHLGKHKLKIGLELIVNVYQCNQCGDVTTTLEPILQPLKCSEIYIPDEVKK